MQPAAAHQILTAGPWNPGLESAIPAELRPLTTLLRPENVATTFAEARELRDLTGLGWCDVVAFRPSRLALHEVLIRVSADLAVPDLGRVEDLGIQFRAMTRRLLAHMQPRMAELEALHRQARDDMHAFASRTLAGLDPDHAAAGAVEWTTASRPNALEQATLRALGIVASAILVKHGRLWGPRQVIASLAATIAGNAYGSEAIGRALDPWFREAARAEGYAELPPQQSPIVMNTKGASASGKTTIRPLQRRLAREIGADWSQFALVSPDIWRKQLLDYASLGEAFRYAGSFTGEELRIVDQKLDAHMARKSHAGRMSHLLIDRFRFDSFAAHSDEAGSNLLTRFGRVVYLFFMVTHPASLVQRAWNRGEEVGRYKAVDDTLAHAVEAYNGMPELFFTWIQRRDKRVHFEFLDNEVPAGERPLTAAYGWNDTLTILDAKPLIDVARYRRIDVNARSPEALFPNASLLADEHNRGFLDECLRRFARVRYADRATLRVTRIVENGGERSVDEPLREEDRRQTVGRWRADEA